MLGISIYLSKDHIEKNLQLIQSAKASGFQSIFTSLHIPEDDPSTYKELLQLLGQQAKDHQMELIADISPKSLSYLGLNYSSVTELVNWGVAGLRVDYGLSEKQISELSKKMKVALNASTITEEFLETLLQNDLCIENVEAWHNFYPRPETGLSKRYLIEKNRWLKKCGITTMAFIPGDSEKRGPLYKGLPTLEKHRETIPLHAYFELIKSCYVDKVLVGDISLMKETMENLALAKDYIPLRYKPDLSEQTLLKSIEEIHTNREDPARDVIRSMESRLYGRFGHVKLLPNNTIDRVRGSITIDNELYGRYAGEMQITLTNLPSDPKVNVVGKVIDEDLQLLSYIGAGSNFKLIPVKDKPLQTV
ncbi:MupG family TIM beta-alpha barrel fold protein [Gottfriedia sp. OAE603]|uniref:DUF871 domain-containing protein n=1 Tax=Gottfriedia sp. OAE603 TaxID=2663872 RepID=UPI001788F226